MVTLSVVRRLAQATGIVSLLALAVTPNAFAAQLDAQSKQEISHLISYLAESGCKFNRNGSWYAAPRAVEHINAKYNYLVKRDLIRNTEDFIQRAASESNASKKPYKVKCGSQPEVQSAAWFREALGKFRKETGAAARRD